jgi:protein TonB
VTRTPAPTPPAPEVAVAAPPPAPTSTPAPSPTQTATPAPAPTPQATAIAAGAGAPGKPGPANGHGRGDEGTGHGIFGNGTDGPGDDYLEALRRWLAEHKRYPEEAIDKKEEGKVIVGFTLRRDGTVLDAWIVRSSGVAILDRAALAMLHDASPVPPVPARYKGDELTLAMPVDYSIGLLDRLFR